VRIWRWVWEGFPADRQAVRTLTSPVQTIHSVFDSSGNRIAEYDQTSGALLREYVWNGLTPVAVIENGVVYFVRVDHIGRSVFATNAAGAKVWTATYTPFGEVHASTGTPIALRFPGQWFQSESGLHQNWMRDYDPTTGRYLEADPLGLVDGASVYGYARQNPMRFIDPDGENPILACVVSPVCSSAVMATLTIIYHYLSEDCYSWLDVLYDVLSNINRPVRIGTGIGSRMTGDDGASGGGTGAGSGSGFGQNSESSVGGGGGYEPPASSLVGRRDGGVEGRDPQLHTPDGAPRNASGEVGGLDYSGHAFDRMQDRGITPSVVESAISNGTVSPGRGGVRIYHDSVTGVTVIVSGSGRVITVY
jgi:RHS repeat-associated protein